MKSKKPFNATIESCTRDQRKNREIHLIIEGIIKTNYLLNTMLLTLNLIREIREYYRETIENNYILLTLFQLRKLKFRVASHQRQ